MGMLINAHANRPVPELLLLITVSASKIETAMIIVG